MKLPIAALANPNDVSNGLAVSLPKLIVPKFVPNTLTDSALQAVIVVVPGLERVAAGDLRQADRQVRVGCSRRLFNPTLGGPLRWPLAIRLPQLKFGAL